MAGMPETWIWAFFKSLWVHGIVLIVAITLLPIIGYGIVNFNADTGTVQELVIVLLVVALNIGPFIVAGSLGNIWREHSMTARGYKYVQTVEGGAADAVVAIVSVSGES